MYIDDVIVFSNNEKEHFDHLEVLALLDEAGVKLKQQKCFFFQETIEYLGNIITPGRLSAERDAKVTQSVWESSFPRTVTQMKSFPGACNEYNSFVKSFAKTSQPLSDKLKEFSGVEWEKDLTPYQGHAFDTLKAHLTTAPVLVLPKPNLPYMLDSDASQKAVGAVLLQKQDDENPKEWATVGYWSKTLSKEQRNYSETEK